MFDVKNIYKATSIKEAIKLRVDHPQAILISGGSDVLIKIREGKLRGCELISINHIEELKGISENENQDIIIKAATSFTNINNNPIINKHIPILSDAVDKVGGPQIRNVGTIGGNISNGVTSADSASSLFALEAKLKLEGEKGARIIPIQEYYVAASKVSLKEDEILTEIIIEKENYMDFYGHYIKYAMRNAMDIATLGCAVLCKLDDTKNTLKDIKIAFGVAGPIPLRCYKTEQKYKGEKITNSLLKNISVSCIDEVNPRSSWRASKDFRLHLVKQLSFESLKQAIINAGGKKID